MRKTLDLITLILVIVGAINWGLVGLFEFDLVAEITGDSFGELNALSRIIFTLVGLSGLYQLSNVARVLSDDRDHVTATNAVPESRF